MSMMALSLSVGILVDDSIVVLENIYRHFELGSTPFTAALKGRSEIGLAAIAITLVDVVVYAPVGFVSGFVGQFFKEFGLTIVAATLLSLFMSFTLTPMLAARWLRVENPQSRSPLAIFGRFWEAGFERLQLGYRNLLGAALRFRWIVVLLGIGSFAAGIALPALGLVGSEFVPNSDQGQFTIQVEMPTGSTLAATQAAAQRVEARAREIPEVKYTLITIGYSGEFGGGSGAANNATIQVQLVDLSARSRSVDEVAAQVRSLGSLVPGMKLTVQLPNNSGGSAQPIQVQVQGSDPVYLQQVASQVEDVVRRTAGTTDVTNSFALGQPQIDVRVDRAKAADLGLSASQIGTAVATAINGQVATQLQPPGQKAIDVRVQADGASVQSVQDVSKIPLVTPSGAVVSLGQVAGVSLAGGPTQIERKNRQRIVTIGANVTGRPLGAVSQELQAKFSAMPLRSGTTVSMGGSTQQEADAFLQLFEALGLSILLMYMLMVALYESLLYPLVIMLSVPLASAGALGGLWLTGNTLNMMSAIGIIMLCGIVAKNAILLVDYTNTLRKRGVPRNLALLEAGPVRLRPILMTTAAMVFAMLPSALKIGEGAELRAPMAVVVIGGLLTSTLLTLVFIPAVYTIVDDVRRLVGRLLGGGRKEPVATELVLEADPVLVR
jgi:HAE1 family hydrophobic/amphiphilic exporter-1